jgi:amidase
MRRSILSAVILWFAVLALQAQPARRPRATPAGPPFTIVEASISEMQRAMAEGRVTSRELVRQSLERIAYYEDLLNATIAVNRAALAEADRLDGERAQGRVRGPLHGIPIALKDNIHVAGMPTTGGALAFAGLVPPYEATLTKHLRDAGAVIVAKTAMTELANWVAGSPSPMPNNYSGLGGYAFNPYDPRRDPRDRSRSADFSASPDRTAGGVTLMP